MNAIANALVVGGGVGGMSAAIALSRIGLSVDLIDIDPNWGVLGAGITITGPTLRAFKALGVYEEILAHAYVGDGIQVCDTQGVPLRCLPTPMPDDAGVYSSGGIMRPALHAILATRVSALGVYVRTGLTVDRLDQAPSSVNVLFSDGSTSNYDLVIGADGLNSHVRQLILPHAPKPSYTGQMCWRVAVRRPPEVERRTYFLGGPSKVGVTPVSADQMYMFINQRSDKIFHRGDGLHLGMAALLEDYGGPIIQSVLSQLSPHSNINVRPLEGFVMEPPWHLGRVLLIGDAVHPTTPQLASGAGIAVEDALVLAEEIAKGRTVAETIDAFTQRRESRCKLVVESSVKIGKLEQAGAPVEQQTAIVEQALARLAEPA